MTTNLSAKVFLPDQAMPGDDEVLVPSPTSPTSPSPSETAVSDDDHERDAEILRRAIDLVDQDPEASSHIEAGKLWWFGRAAKIATLREQDIRTRIPLAEASVRADEEREVAKQQLIEEHRMIVAKLLKYAAIYHQVIAVLNSKGGSGKSPLAIYLAVVLYVLINEMILLIDANENDGTTAKGAGVDPNLTASIREALAQPELYMDFDSITRQLLKPDNYNVRVMSSDAGGHEEINGEDFEKLLHQLKLYGGHSMILDTGNGNIKTPNLAAARIASTHVFTALADDPDTFEKLLSTMYAYTQLGLGDKVRRGFIVVSATRPGQTAEGFYDQLCATNVKVKVKTKENPNAEPRWIRPQDFNITPDRILLVAYSEYIKKRRPANHMRIGPETFWDYARILVRIFEQEDAHYVPPQHQGCLPMSTLTESDPQPVHAD